MKLLRLVYSNLLFFATCFLLAFVPLYPKLPIIGITHTWVYVRLEDFAVAAVLTLWIFLVLFKKVKLKTPLTAPIFLFWVIGAISTIHGVLILFPTLANVFSNVALLNFIRRIEYLSLFFVAYSAIRDKKAIYYVIGVLTIVLLLVIFYGFGQKFLGFPAFLTGNEEFAKGVPLQISELGRVPSTFAGHYDLAAYLVLVIPIFVSLYLFGFKGIFLRGLFLVTSALGFVLLFMTVSRVSFVVLIISLFILLISQRKKIFLFVLLAVIGVLLILLPNLTRRFSSTLTDVNVLVDAKTGVAVSEVRELPHSYFKDKIVLRDNSTLKDTKATTSAILPFDEIPNIVEFLVPANVSTGENLPQGTGYVNLELSPIIRRSDMYMTLVKDTSGNKPDEIRSYLGNFLVKRARAYDLSFTTRFQGEWPRTIDAFKRNIFLGSGYGSVSLAVDNNYLRILGESGLFGFASFLGLFLIGGVFLKKTYDKIDSPVVRSFILGFAAGTFGLLLNATLIDVFEASKIAFSFWLLAGVTLGISHLYSHDTKIESKDLRTILLSPYAIAVYLLVITFVLFSPLYANYFVGDDFTWLRWVADTKSSILSYFTNSDGFFFRPGARIYFLLMYKSFWLNQAFYHFASIVLHYVVSLLIFITLWKILNRYILAIIGAILFLTLSGHHEAVFWISSTGFLFSSIFTLLALLFYIFFKEKQKNLYLWLSILCIFLSPLFHELGVVTPLIIIAYDLIFKELKRKINRIHLALLAPLLPYFLLRLFSGSLWFGGDYSYSISKLPFNIIGNTIGYFVLDLLGPQSLNFYESLRNILKGNLIMAFIGSMVLVFVIFWLGRIILRKLNFEERKILYFGFIFFVLGLLPFLGLGNIASRYSYLSSVGFVIVLAMLLEKLFSYIRTLSDKYTFSMIIVLFSMIFLSFQLFQLQNIHSDWTVAGQKVQKFLVSFEDVFLLNKYGTYDEFDKNTKANFLFVDTPIKRGEAWVFPVGIKDALWFALHSNFNAESAKSLNDAIYKSEITPNTSVFIFEDDGSVRKAFKTGDNIMILPKKD